MLNKIVSLVIALLSIDVFIIIYNKVTSLQLKSINRRIEKEGKMLEKDYDLWTIKDVRSKSVIIIYSILIVASWFVGITKDFSNLGSLLRYIFSWGIFSFLIFLNIRILFVRSKRIIQQLRGKF